MTVTSSTSEAQLSCRILTAAGVGAIAVLRVEGDGAWQTVRARVKGRKHSLPDSPVAGRAYYGDFFDDDDRIDDVILAAHTCVSPSATAVDICCHGGRRVVERVMLTMHAAGAKVLTNPWETTTRLTWAEALARCADRCLSKATTRRGVLFLLTQRRLLATFFEEMLNQLGGADDAVGRARIAELVARSGAAHRYHEPAEVIWVGEPNVGKSSLVNCLTGRDSAIVHGEAGTTRDWVTVNASLLGVPVTLIDTAGFRVACDPLEAQAVEQGQRRAARADVIVEVVSAGDAAGSSKPSERPNRWGREPDLRVVNKTDLVESAVGKPRRMAPTHAGEIPVVYVSAHTGAGLDDLRVALLDCLGLESESDASTRVLLFDRNLRDRLGKLCSSGELTRESVIKAMEQADFGV